MDRVASRCAARNFPGWLACIQLLGTALWFDLVTVMLPIRLSYVYSALVAERLWTWRYIPTLAVFAGMILLWRSRSKWGRGPFAAAGA